MSTALPKEALRTLVSSLTGVPANLVVWAGEPRKFSGPQGGVVYGILTLNMVTSKAVGDDDIRGTWDGANIVYEQRADREVTISARYEAQGTEEGFDALERLRTRLKWESSLDALRAVNLSLIETIGIQTYNQRKDNRDIATAQLDLRLNFTGTDTPPAGANIASVSGTNQIDGKPFVIP